MIQKPESGAKDVAALARKIAPSERRAWFDAMVAEFDHVPDDKRWQFAVGCLFAAIRERLAAPQFLHALARNLLIGGAMIWAAMNIRFAGRMSAMDALVPEVFGYGIALLFVVGAFATARFGYRATIGLAVPLAVVLAVAAVIIRFGNTPTPVSNLYLALIVEDVLILGIALMIAGAAARLVSVQRAQG
ncbi:MAG: hypothetical protein H2054_12545 [Sphingomonas sp.]|uniref:hypothetical protein n=1 Tax=Sphingomonas sp. TaxID=28214 RepID=UPI0018285AE5|nr:hypothetical protein [Sphingomonas sp.]